MTFLWEAQPDLVGSGRESCSRMNLTLGLMLKKSSTRPITRKHGHFHSKKNIGACTSTQWDCNSVICLKFGHVGYELWHIKCLAVLVQSISHAHDRVCSKS